MPEGLVYLAQAIVHFAAPWALFEIFWSTLLGIAIGALPGLTATLGVALLTTLTFRMDPGDALLILICSYVGAIYGGSRSAILLNIPGTPANAATTLDGFPLARAGQAGRAMGLATTGSFLGSLIGMLLLAVVAPLLAEFALDFGSFEFFWLAVFGIVISGHLTALDDPLKGWIAGFLGLMVAMVGQEGIQSYQRFTFGSTQVAGGFGLLPALVGAFGFAEVIMVMAQPAYQSVRAATDRVVPNWREVVVYWRTIIRSGVIGTLMGLIPGVGEDIGAWASYAAARRASKEADKFGKGSVEGLLAAETGNNAAVPGAIIPVLTLAVPGSAPSAVLLAAMFIHGVRPGPLIMIEFPSFVYQVVAMILYASFAILILGLALARPLLLVLSISRERLMPIIFTLCTIGSFAIASRLFDVWVMLGFGIVGFLLRIMGYPMAPLVLGIVLGDLLDKSFRRGMVLSDGSLVPFLTRPISAALWIMTAITILMSFRILREPLARLFRRPS
jgi:putative tricarboxylic transport membrane protein